ncbi:hypothetical protein [Desulforamulus hydrothermalis]|uniref:hypothetical protein n=1 Tax=Desulforamulus hydrothermalis TaxID=412895 RepID=UPI0011603D63|nr:hypothetical protein [Desulforamulus hydrothermalis]
MAPGRYASDGALICFDTVLMHIIPAALLIGTAAAPAAAAAKAAAQRSQGKIFYSACKTPKIGMHQGSLPPKPDPKSILA